MLLKALEDATRVYYEIPEDAHQLEITELAYNGHGCCDRDPAGVETETTYLHTVKNRKKPQRKTHIFYGNLREFIDELDRKLNEGPS